MAHSCCNPFDIPGHAWSSHKKNLRPVTERMCERAPYISIGSKICDTCKKKLSRESPVLTPEPDSPSPEAEEIQSLYVQTPAAVASLNKCLAEFGETDQPFGKTVKTCNCSFVLLLPETSLLAVGSFHFNFSSDNCMLHCFSNIFNLLSGVILCTGFALRIGL